ncbi:hypothetical protein ACQP2T_55785 [Nonomuraea sp. CA-143628]|uniref:hypothetical protein n=1 Tax=Nonomuraea sp. CA-143628 TaxID=3239997 RepID=UPI003D8BECA3
MRALPLVARTAALVAAIFLAAPALSAAANPLPRPVVPGGPPVDKLSALSPPAP